MTAEGAPPTRRRLLIGCAVSSVLLALCCCGGIVAYWFDGGGTDGNQFANGPCLVASDITTSTVLPAVDPWTAEQVKNAAIIVSVGQKLGVVPRGWVIAVATAIQESDLHNLGDLGTANDHDSLGLFQQRPSQGWGTAAQIEDPTYASAKFYDKLITVAGWQSLPLTDAAQAVQRSAFPDAYAKWEPDATQLVGSLVAVSTPTNPSDVSQACSLDASDQQINYAAVGLPAGFTLPVDTPGSIVAAINWSLQQIGTPYSFGGSCTGAHSGKPALECDCSSLTQQSYKAGGITLPRTAAEQAYTGTAIFSLANLLPGDLLFLVGSDGTPTEPGHVGMYLGHGIIIEAPHTGTVVRLTTTGAWASLVVAVRRMVTWPPVTP